MNDVNFSGNGRRKKYDTDEIPIITPEDLDIQKAQEARWKQQYGHNIINQNGAVPSQNQASRQSKRAFDDYSGNNYNMNTSNDPYYMNGYNNQNYADINSSSGRKAQPSSNERRAYQQSNSYQHNRQQAFSQRQQPYSHRNNAADVRNNYRDSYSSRVPADSRSSAAGAAPQKPKKKGKFGKIIISLILIAAILFGASFVYIYSLADKTNYVKSQSNQYIASSELMSDKKTKNILLLGVDDDKNTGVSRSDTMMLVSIDTKNKTLKLTSFLRDTYVTIPGKNKKAKLNAACTYGGAQLVMDTIEYNFHIDIENYLLVNFEMFEKIVDDLGGITVEVTPKEAAYINKTTHINNLKSGKVKLNGDVALIYSRIRKLDSDLYRTQRQRKVISAIVAKAKSTNVLTLSKMASNIMPLITTDIPAFNLTLFAYGSVKYMNYKIDQLQIPASGTYTERSYNMLPDFDKNISLMKSFIYG